MLGPVIPFLAICLSIAKRRHSLALENLALRQQLTSAMHLSRRSGQADRAAPRDLRSSGRSWKSIADHWRISAKFP